MIEQNPPTYTSSISLLNYSSSSSLNEETLELYTIYKKGKKKVKEKEDEVGDMEGK